MAFWIAILTAFVIYFFHKSLIDTKRGNAMTMNELIQAVADAYRNPAEGEEDRNGNTRLAVLQEKFHLSSLKVQKILVTAGVY